MVSPASSVELSDSDQVLTRAVCAFQTGAWRDRPAAPEVITALLNAEKTAKRQQIEYPQSAILGAWQLCFTTTGKTHLKHGQPTRRGGFYAPRFAIAQISFYPAPTAEVAEAGDLVVGAIGNQVQVGSLMFRVEGHARYQAPKNLLVFDFNQMQLQLFGRSLFQGKFPGRSGAIAFSQQPIAKLPFFAFFWVTPTAIAARGRGGGLALWVRHPV